MTRTRAWVVGLGCWALTGCGGVSVTSGDSGPDAARGDAGADVGADLPGKEIAADAPAKDAPDAKEVGFPDGPTCPIESDHGTLAPSATCTVASQATMDATCPGSTTCPVGSMFQLTCKGGGIGPWLAPTGTGAAVMYVTNSGSFVTRLFTLGPGTTARVDDVPGLTSATNALATDTDGNPTIFAGEMPGVWRVRKTAQGWKRDVVLETGGPLALVTDGRARDATNAATVFWSLTNQVSYLATREGACWRMQPLPGSRSTYMGMDLDAMNRAWVAWLGYPTPTTTALQLAGPDGLHDVWTTQTTSGLSINDQPVVLAGGFTGTGAFPALAIQRADAVHVFAPTVTLGWGDRPLPGSAMAVRGGNCPPLGPSSCNGLTTCTATTKGALGGFGLARTSAGRVYAAWLAGEGESTYSLSQIGGPTFCPIAPAPAGPAAAAAPPGDGARVAPPLCMCTQTQTSSRGSVSVVVARVDGPAPIEVLRVQIDVGAEPRWNGLKMTARGDALLVVASNGSGPDVRLRYLEIDSTKLP